MLAVTFEPPSRPIAQWLDDSSRFEASQLVPRSLTSRRTDKQYYPRSLTVTQFGFAQSQMRVIATSIVQIGI